MAFLDFLFGRGERTNPRRGGFSDFLFGSPERIQQFERFTPQQQNVLNQILGGAQQTLPEGLNFIQQILSNNPELMRQFEAPARRAFEEQTIPSIAERFTGMNGQRSSAFGQQLGRAAASLEEGLAAQRAGRGFQALGGLQNLLGTGLTPSFETALRPSTPGFLQTGLQSLAGSLPYLLL